MKNESENGIDTDTAAGAAAPAAASRETTVNTAVKPGAAAEAAASVSIQFSFFILIFHFSFAFFILILIFYFIFAKVGTIWHDDFPHRTTEGGVLPILSTQILILSFRHSVTKTNKFLNQGIYQIPLGVI